MGTSEVLNKTYSGGYAEKCPDSPDVAFEVPTGTGKTAIGLLIAEWKRDSSNKVAYLALTNQLAGQVLVEAKKLGIACADLRGTKDTRDPQEEGRYKTGSAVAVTTYANLFNIKPIIQQSELIVFDDAHGGEQYASDMWTVSVRAEDAPDLYNALVIALKPGISESQLRTIMDKSAFSSVELADLPGHPECIQNVTAVLDQVTSDDIRFAWKLIRNKLQSCLFLLSPLEITIRPLVPPTHTHSPFGATKQRIYMSATLGGQSDLQRAYGIEKIQTIRAQSPQWGRRYVFIPGLYTDGPTATRIISNVWDRLQTRRAVLLAPSDRIASRIYSELEQQMTEKPVRMGASDIKDSLASFTGSTDALLILAGRYDGLDLPDDQCRLLILAESPAAINPLERHLRDRWKMGPILRRRERTRLIQGMGRCTRNATDFAVIVWLGQSLINAATHTSLVEGMPSELSAEIAWGKEQSQIAGSQPEQLVDMILGLVDDSQYRDSANTSISSVQTKGSKRQAPEYEETGANEVHFARAMWDENYPHALEMARSIADKLNSPELSGYRAWWWFLASIAARLTDEARTEQDCLRRGSKCGVNAGWLNQLLQQRTRSTTFEGSAGLEPNAEGIWHALTAWGWAGPCFDQKLKEMLMKLNQHVHKPYVEGLDLLGMCFGAKTTRITEQGAPDVAWSFAMDFHIGFEGKPEKQQHAKLSKRDTQEAKGHIDWIKSKLARNPLSAEIVSLMVAPSASLDEVALPFAEGLLYASLQQLAALSEAVADRLRKIRIEFAGREFAEAATEFSAEIRNANLDLPSLKTGLLSQPLLPKS